MAFTALPTEGRTCALWLTIACTACASASWRFWVVFVVLGAVLADVVGPPPPCDDLVDRRRRRQLLAEAIPEHARHPRLGGRNEQAGLPRRSRELVAEQVLEKLGVGQDLRAEIAHQAFHDLVGLPAAVPGAVSH